MKSYTIVITIARLCILTSILTWIGGCSGGGGGGVVGDIIAPAVDITSPLTSTPANGSVVITFTDDELNAPQVSVDNTNWTNATSGVTTLGDIAQFAGLPEGEFTLYLQDSDEAGNTGTDQIFVIKDITPPTLNITGPASAATVNAATKITFTDSEENAPRVSIDNTNWTNATSNVTTFGDIAEFSGLGETGFTLYLKDTDAAGNTSSCSVSLTKDTIAPTVAITAPAAAAMVNGTAVITFTNNGTAPKVSVDNANWIDATSSVTTLANIAQFAGLSESAFTLYLKDTDAAGNTGTDSISLTKDTTAPVASISGQPADTNNTLALDITVSGTDVQYYKYKVGLTGSTDCSSGTGYDSDVAVTTHITDNITGLADGDIRLCVVGKDTAGNYQSYVAATSATWTKDATPPTATISGEPTGTNSTTVLSVDVSGTDVQYYKYKVGESASTDCSDENYYSSGVDSSINITDNISSLSNVEIKLCVVGRDIVGNYQAYASATSATWTKDTSFPTATISGQPTGTNNVSMLNVDVDGTNIQNYKYKVGAAGTTVCSNATDYTVSITAATNITDDISGLGNDSVKLCVVGQNTALTWQDYSAATSATWTRDTAVPTLSQAETMDIDHDGKIDYYKLTFSEDVKDSLFPGYSANALGAVTSEWLVQNYSNVRLAHGTAAPQSDTVNDTVLYLKFDENASDCSSTSQVGCDTGVKPDLTTTASPGLTDTAGNTLTQVATGFVEWDRAKPVVVFTQSVSTTGVKIIFSETMAQTSAETIGNYSCTGGLSFSAASRDSGNNAVVNLTSSTQASLTYTLTASDSILDEQNNGVNTSANSGNFDGIVLPSVSSAVATAYNKVRVTFSETVTASSAECANTSACSVIYYITGLTVTNSVSTAGSGVNSTQFYLTTTDQIEGNSHTLTVTANTVTSASTGLKIGSTGNSYNFTGDGRPLVSVSNDTVTACPGNSYKRVVLQYDQAMTTSGGGSVTGTGSYSITDCPTANCSSGNPQATASSVTWDSGAKKAAVTFNTAFDNDGSQYQITITTVQDSNGNAVATTNLNFQCGPDTAAPQLNLAQAVNAAQVLLSFSEEVLAGSGANGAENTNNYNIDGAGLGVNILSATKQALGSQVMLVLSSSLAQGGHNVEVENVKDLNSNTIVNDDIQNKQPFTIDVPQTFDQGPVFDNPFSDSVVTGMIFATGNKLYVGPDSTEGKIFEMTPNMAVSQTITLDSNSVTPTTDEDFYLPSIYPTVRGIDAFYSSSIAGTTTTFIGGWQAVGNYDAIWMLTNPSGTTWRYTCKTGLETGGAAYRSMSMQAYKEQLYIALQDQGGGAVKFSRMCAKSPTCTNGNAYGTIVKLTGKNLNKIGGGTNDNGQYIATDLISIDSMFEYDHDGAGTDESRLYLASGGTTTDINATGGYRTTGGWDGGILRTTSTYSTAANPPPALSSGDTVFEDVTPSVAKWLDYMSIPLPYNAAAGGDWDSIIPANKITPALKAVPYMRTAPNGDLYLIRNACSDTTKYSVALGNFISNGRQTCKAGKEVPQLWMLPKGSTGSPKGAADWKLVGEYASTGKTSMAGNTGGCGTSPNKCLSNKHITLLEISGSYLYIGYDNADYGLNIWYTDMNGIASGTQLSEDDFSLMSVFGLKKSNGDPDPTNNTRIYSNVSVNDEGTDYLVITTGNGANAVRIFRTKSE